MNLSRSLPTLAAIFAFATLVPCAVAQVTVGVPRTTVRGTVFDSLTMLPAAGTDVWVLGGTKTTKTNEEGQFELDDVATGEQFIGFSSPALDSLGLGQLGKRVIVGNNTRIELATPSFTRLWRVMCTGEKRTGSDSGIVWGTIRDANSDTRQSGALAVFNWYALSLNKEKRYDFAEETYNARTDSTGTYYACGLPHDVRLLSDARGSRAASGSIEYVIGDRRITRLDLLVSPDMVIVADSSNGAGSNARGTARLRGRVVDFKGKDVVGALVSLASLDTTVRTNQLGEFTLLNLPSGTHGVQVRQVGYTPAATTVELRADQLTTIRVDMPNPQNLATVNVRSERVMGIDQADFAKRLKQRMGYAMQEKELRGLPNISSAFRSMPSLTVNSSRGQMNVLMSNRRGGMCAPTIYLDKVRTTADQIDVFKVEDFVAVEVFSKFQVPVGIESGTELCGVILLWTKRNPRW